MATREKENKSKKKSHIISENWVIQIENVIDTKCVLCSKKCHFTKKREQTHTWREQQKRGGWNVRKFFYGQFRKKINDILCVHRFPLTSSAAISREQWKRQLNKTQLESLQVRKEEKGERKVAHKDRDRERERVTLLDVNAQRNYYFATKFPYGFCISLYITRKRKKMLFFPILVSLNCGASKRFQHMAMYVSEWQRQRKTDMRKRIKTWTHSLCRLYSATNMQYIINCIMFENICFYFI